MQVELFVLDERTRLVDLNKEWISTVKEFKKLLTRDRGSEGDADGRKKLKATKEFTFIYHLCDYKSQFSNYSDSDRLLNAKQNADLPEKYDYTKDEDLLIAIKRYKALQESPALQILKESKEGLHSAHRVIKKIREALEIKLEAADLTQLEEVEGKNGKKIIIDPVAKITTDLESLIKLSNLIGPTLKNLKDLEDQVKKELGDKESLRGGKEKGTREDAPAMLSYSGGDEDDEERGDVEQYTSNTIFDDL